MPDVPITISGWESYWAEVGGVYSLSYLSPPSGVCRADRRAYELLTARPGIAKLGLVSGSGVNDPAAGWRRIGDVWEGWITIARAGTLGALLPTSLKPCEGVSSVYSLRMVNRHRTSGNVFQASAARLTDLAEGNSPGDVIGRAAAGVTGGVLNIAVESLLPVAIPVIIGLWAFQKYAR